MKLRIRGDSLRIRVSQTELAELESSGRAGDTIHFPSGAELRYGLEITAGTEVSVADGDGEIKVLIPRPVFERWCEPEEVSLVAEQPLAGRDALKILVEKDFTCLSPRDDEDDSDLFQNPANQ